jgi:hypothetical protein
MPRSSIFLFIVSLGLFSACTAWQYEIEACDPSARDLSRDVCNQLNGVALGCMIYQCDGQTLSCQQSARDFDRDGDPDTSCGGTDCNDYDPRVFGREGDLCTCKPDVIGTDCTVGQPGSTCERKGKYACVNSGLSCPAMAGMPLDEYQSGGDLVNMSWDWNCDGTVERACSWQDFTGRYYRTDCPATPTLCNDTRRMQIAMNMSPALCAGYCGGYTSRDPCNAMTNKPAVLNCDAQPDCGSRIGVCHCRWEVSLAPPNFGTCIAESYSTIGSIYCR